MKLRTQAGGVGRGEEGEATQHGAGSCANTVALPIINRGFRHHIPSGAWVCLLVQRGDSF